MKLIISVLAVFFALLCGCEGREAALGRKAEPSQRDMHSGEKGKADFSHAFVNRTEEEIVDILQERTDLAGSPDLDWYSLLLDIWYEREDTHPQLAWSVLKSARVKVVLASELAQAFRNRIIPPNVGDIRNFALSNYSSADARVAQQSILLLGKIGQADDIPLLVQIAQFGVNGKPRLKEALTALGYICDQEAVRAIEGLVLRASDDDREFAKGVLGNREHIMRSWCH